MIDNFLLLKQLLQGFVVWKLFRERRLSLLGYRDLLAVLRRDVDLVIEIRADFTPDHGAYLRGKGGLGLLVLCGCLVRVGMANSDCLADE